MSWIKYYKFSDLYEMSSGISSKPEQAGHGANFLSFSTVFNNYFLPEVLDDKMDTSDDEQETYSILEGDIFLTRTSETIDELGMSCVAIKEYPKSTFSGFLKRLRPTQNDITYPKFMAFYLRSELFRKTMTNNAIMTLRASLNLQIFSYLDLLLPTFENQKAIGDLLFDLSRKIDLNNRINAELEGMAKLIYDYWFVQFDFPISEGQAAAMGRPELKGKPYKSSGGKMVWNKELKREVPEGWKVKKLSEIANILMGQSPPGSSYNEDEKGEIFFQGCTDFGWRFPTVRLYTTAPSRMAKSGDILLSVRAPVGTLNIASVDCCIGRGLAALNSRDGFDSYLSYLMGYYKQIFDRHNTDGTTFGAITKNDLFGLKLIYPSKSILRNYDNLVKKYNSMILVNHNQSETLTELRDWLLPMLMNGQVRVRGGAEEMKMAAEPEGIYGVKDKE